MEQNRNIMIIDDDVDYAEAQQEFLEDNDYNIISANSISEALDKIKNNDVCVALVDIRLGNGNGVELIRDLKECNPELICIMVTAYASISTAVEAIKHGAFEYLTKPIKPEALLATLERVFEVISLHEERNLARDALLREQERAQVTLEAIGDGVISTDINGRIEYMNPAAENITNWNISTAKGLSIDKVIKLKNEISKKTVDNPVYKCLRENVVLDLPKTVVLSRHDGVDISIENSAAPIKNDDQVIGAVLVIRDVTESRRLAEKISYQAQHDSLTGLINRMEFEHRLESSLANAKSNNEQHALLYIDLDQFKVVNDTCGHVAGDELLCQLTTLFKSELHDNLTLARLGGDEFGILAEHQTTNDAYTIADKILHICQNYRFSWQDKSFTIGASIGMVSITPETVSTSDLLSQADTACYTAKDMGRNRIHVYDASDKDYLIRHSEMQWVAKIQKALDENRFRLFYQKIIPVSKHISHEDHYELLIRLEGENKELIPPGAFISAAERYNLMRKIDRWVVKEAFEHFSRNKDVLNRLALCTVNLSGQTLSDYDFINYVVECFDTYEIPPEKICFEITETSAISNLKNAMHLIVELKTRGCLFALDDFGSGLSSFAYLKNIPVDYLKIDGAFVKGIAKDPIDYAMVKSINDVGHVMGKQIIAEFVEDEQILDKLREIGVDFAQGYHIAMPSPILELFS